MHGAEAVEALALGVGLTKLLMPKSMLTPPPLTVSSCGRQVESLRRGDGTLPLPYHHLEAVEGLLYLAGVLENFH